MHTRHSNITRSILTQCSPDVVSSALQCENFIEPFFDASGQPGSTLVAALDKVFSKPP
jgi:hypothetical protein